MALWHWRLDRKPSCAAHRRIPSVHHPARREAVWARERASILFLLLCGVLTIYISVWQHLVRYLFADSSPFLHRGVLCPNVLPRDVTERLETLTRSLNTCATSPFTLADLGSARRRSCLVYHCVNSYATRASYSYSTGNILHSTRTDIPYVCSYANSVLQALYFCGPFRDLLLQYPDPSVSDVPPPPPALPSPPPPPPTKPKPSRKLSVSDSPHIGSPNPPHGGSASGPNASGGTNLPGAIPIPPSPPTLLSALRSLYLHISRNPADKGTVAPRAFIDKLKELNELFRTPQHQDAHEFLNFMLNKIEEEMEEDRRNGVVGAGNSIGTSASGEDCK